MMRRGRVLFLAGTLLFAQTPWAPSYAENTMGYRVLAVDEASSLPRNGGSLGMDIERAQRITDTGMTFDLIGINRVRSGSAAAKAGLRAGDKIIAVDGRVFPTLASFASYVGSKQPGSQVMVDYLPKGAGPANAQRLVVNVGNQRGVAVPSTGNEASTGMSTGKKIAIGAGVAAILCYKFGCLSRLREIQQSGQNGSMMPIPGR